MLFRHPVFESSVFKTELKVQRFKDNETDTLLLKDKINQINFKNKLFNLFPVNKLLEIGRAKSPNTCFKKDVGR